MNIPQLLRDYTGNEILIDELWEEIKEHYSGKKRYYHTLEHLENIFIQLSEVKSQIENWNAILFTLFYHDIIYSATKSDNEEKSAQLAEKRMKEISVPDNITALCKEQILATKSHDISSNNDTNYFTDADLSILGQPWEGYSRYYQNVRNEYFIYPDFVYNPGRKKVINHFLKMDRIFKTEFFHNKYEQKAKNNLFREMELL